MELPGLNPLGTMAALAADAPVRRLQQVTRVTARDGADGPSADGRQQPDQRTSTAQARDVSALRDAIERQALPAGPPPAFQMNVLEAESGPDQVLARIEATRSWQRDAPALGPAPQTPQDAPRVGPDHGAETPPAAADAPDPQHPIAPTFATD